MKTEFPRARLERIPMGDPRRFKLTVHSDKFQTDTSGALFIWLDRGDIANLQHDCSNSLLDDDIESGMVVEELL